MVAPSGHTAALPRTLIPAAAAAAEQPWSADEILK